MDRLTTDNPRTNLQALLNYAYAKDKAVHLAFGNGEENIPLDEYIAHEACQRGCQTTTTDVMEGGCLECDCPIAILNTVAIQAAELRGRLKMIEDILGDTYDLDHLRELIEADREDSRPLTIEELRQIDGEPVWLDGFEWRVCYGTSTFRGSEYLETSMGGSIPLDGYGQHWNAYRHKPKEA